MHILVDSEVWDSILEVVVEMTMFVLANGLLQTLFIQM